MEHLTQQFTVTEQDTAVALGSGSIPVLATPRMVAWMENTAMNLCARHTAEGETTVGIAIATTHVKASPVGATITVNAKLTAVDGRKFTLTVSAADSNGNPIGEARHERLTVNAERFMAKL